MTYTIKLNNGTYREASPCDICRTMTAEIHKKAIIGQKSVEFCCQLCYNKNKSSKQQRTAQEVVS
jgi:hypothetical protein